MKRIETIRHTPYSQGPRPSGLLPLPEDEVEAGWPIPVPGQLPEEMRGGHPDQHQKRVRCLPSAVDKAERNLHPDHQ